MKTLSASQIILLLFLVAMLGATVLWSVATWNSAEGTVMSTDGWIALGLGTFFSLLIGFGLMALMFYSNRSGHDDAADPFRKPRLAPPAGATATLKDDSIGTAKQLVGEITGDGSLALEGEKQKMGLESDDRGKADPLHGLHDLT